jgi:folate-binding protein YgfZ
MNNDYNKIRSGAPGFYKQKRGLMEVWGKEAVQFLNGLISNDVAKLEDNAQMTAAFPNVQGRLLAMVRVLKQSDKFLFETDEVTHEKVFQNLHRFTFAGDFFVEDLSEQFEYFEIFNSDFGMPDTDILVFPTKNTTDCFVPKTIAESFEGDMKESGAIEISDELYETLRIENGVPKYGVDMDETTVVLETGIDEAVSFTKGCYLGQEIIARIHFRGHVAKKLTGLLLSGSPASAGGSVSQPEKNSPPFEGGVAAASADGVVTSEASLLTKEGWRAQRDGVVLSDLSSEDLNLTSPEGKPAGRVTSITYSPKLDKTIALAYVRYEFLAEGTELKIGDRTAKVANFPVL